MGLYFNFDLALKWYLNFRVPKNNKGVFNEDPGLTHLDPMEWHKKKKLMVFLRFSGITMKGEIVQQGEFVHIHYFTFKCKFPHTIIDPTMFELMYISNLQKNQVNSFYKLFGPCTVFMDCADTKIYQPLVQCLMAAHKWTEQYNVKPEP